MYLTRPLPTLFGALFCLLLIFSSTCPAQAGDTVTEALNSAQENWHQGRPAEALNQTRRALVNIWQEVPFQLVEARLVDKEPEGFGVYSPRPNNIFEGKNIKALFYLEPVGYKVKRTQGGQFKFGFSMDLMLVNDKGDIVAGQENFLVREVLSRRFNTEFYLRTSLTLSDVPPGELTAVFRVKDLIGGQHTEAKFPLVFR